MAENINALILPIGADVSQFDKSIKEVKDAYKSLQKEISSKPFNLITEKDRSDLEGYKRTLESLQTSVNRVDFKNITSTSKDARTALTSLSLVAQDAPFGFIGIQNNLPALIQSFGALKQQAGGVQGALSQLSGALIGPAGLFLAFSTVTAAITFAVQKYGSFGAAVDALFGKVDPLKNTLDRLNKSYEDYNKELKSNAEITSLADRSQSGLAQTIDILSKKATDLSLSEKERGRYLNQLKEIDKGYFGQLTTGAENVDKIKKATDEYTTALIANARVKAFQQQLDAIDAQIAPLEIFREELKASAIEAENLRKTSTKLFVDPTEKVTKRLADNADQIEELYKRRTFIVDGLEQAILGFKSLKKEGQDLSKTKFTLSIDSQDLDAAFNLDKIISNVTKLGNTILDTNKPLKERQEALKELIAINPQLFNGLTLEKSGLQSLKTTIEEYTRSLQVLLKEKEFDARASQLNAQFLKIQEKATEDANKAEQDRLSGLIELTYAQDRFGNSTDKIVKKNNKYLDQLGEIQEINEAVLEDLNKALGTENAYEKALKDILNFEEFQKKSIDRITRNLRFLQNPLEGLFGSVLDEGIANWQAFGDAVVKEVKRIAAALLAKGVIQLLGNLLAPGLGSVLGAGFQGISDETLFDFGFGNGSKINFGGVQSGAMQMAGAVNLTLRGSDLVASINRTNTTINRVG